VLGDCGAHILSPKSPPTIESSVFWVDLNTISVNSGLTRLAPGFEFYDPDRNARRIIGEAIQRQFPRRLCNVLQVSLLTSKEYKISNRGIFARFIAGAIQSQATLSQRTREFVIEWISSGNPIVAIDPTSSIDSFLESFLNAILPRKLFQSLIIPQLKHVDIYEISAKFPRQPRTIKHIGLCGPATPRFHDFCLAIESNKQSEITGITLKGARLGDSEIGDLITTCVKRKVTALGLIRVFPE
jgi:hypothetical protein